MPGAFKRLLRTPIRRCFILAEAVIALAFARLLTLFPMVFYTRIFGRAQRATSSSIDPRQLEVARSVGSAVLRAAQMVPFKAVCLEQTLAASMVLRLRGVRTTAYLGVHRNREQREADQNGFNAHAWLRAGNLIVIGGPDVSDYVPVAHFS